MLIFMFALCRYGYAIYKLYITYYLAASYHAGSYYYSTGIYAPSLTATLRPGGVKQVIL